MLKHNQRIYAERIRDQISNLNPQDFCWLCNQAAKIYQRIEVAGCVDNFRISKLSILGTPSLSYQRSQAAGCCGSIDQKVKNKLTGNKFIIGFNYGH